MRKKKMLNRKRITTHYLMSYRKRIAIKKIPINWEMLSFGCVRRHCIAVAGELFMATEHGSHNLSTHLLACFNCHKHRENNALFMNAIQKGKNYEGTKLLPQNMARLCLCFKFMINVLRFHSSYLSALNCRICAQNIERKMKLDRNRSFCTSIGGTHEKQSEKKKDLPSLLNLHKNDLN